MTPELILTICSYVIVCCVAGIIGVTGLYFIQKGKVQKANGLDRYISIKDIPQKVKRKSEKTLAYLNIIIIGKGLNYRIRKLIDVRKPKKIQIRKKEYNINQDAFFLTNRNYISQKLHNLFRREEEYTILFREDSPRPMLMEKPKTGLTAGMLRTAEVSKVTQRALAELFSTALPGRKIIFFIVVVGVIAAVYLVATGTIDLSGMGF